MCDLTSKQFQDEDAAREHVEANRWAKGKFCPHCGGTERIYAIKPRAERKIRKGLNKCGDCGKQFTVTIGTVFQGSRIPLNKWLMAIHLMCASKKGMSALQLSRMLGITYKSTWFMCHRIREAMKDDSETPLGGDAKIVEVDETYWGNTKPRNGDKKGRGYAHKEKIFTLVEREGKARSFHVASVSAATLRPILAKHVLPDSHIMTDEAGVYCQTKVKMTDEFDEHSFVKHGLGEYVRGNVSTNTIESYFATLKRGLVGTFHHVSPVHLKRYVGEFDFRYNFRHVTDKQRAAAALSGVYGKRLMYRAVLGS